jgi:hypothetical protein
VVAKVELDRSKYLSADGVIEEAEFLPPLKRISQAVAMQVAIESLLDVLPLVQAKAVIDGLPSKKSA